MWLSRLAAAFGLAALVGTTAAGAVTHTSPGDWRIVPGQRIGGVALGADRGSVHARLGTPARVRRLSDGTILETWLGPRWKDAGLPGRVKELNRNYVTVFFQHGRAVQVEASSSRFRAEDGLTTGRAASAWLARHAKATQRQHIWIATDPGMASPACKHVLEYGDDVNGGVAWKSGVWGCAAPEPGPEAAPEAVIVHRPGQPVRLNPNDADGYAGTGA